MNQLNKTILVLISLATLAACDNSGKHNPIGLNEKANSASGSSAGQGFAGGNTSGKVTYDKVLPLFQSKCSACHNASSAVPNWMNYTAAAAKTVQLRDRVLVKKNMPLGGKLSDEELSLLEKWLDDGALPAAGESPAPAPTPTPTPTPPAQNPSPSPALPTPNPEPSPGSGSGGGTPPAQPEPTPQQPAEPPSFDAKVFFENNCSACHGTASAGMPSPVIFAQNKDYVINQINAFKGGTRKDLIMGGAMEGMAALLTTPEQTSAIADYLFSQKACDVQPTLDGSLGDAVKGKTLFDNNGCIGCHTDGNQVQAPVLNGQKTSYLVQQLSAFKSNQRQNMFMNGIAQSLSEQDINDISTYINSDQKCNSK